MRNLILSFLLLTLMVTSATGQDTVPHLERMEALPTQSIEPPTIRSLIIASAQADTVTNVSFLERLSVLYSYQSDLMAALAREDDDAATSVLDLAMAELGELVRRDYIAEDPRFNSVYRVLVEEYERVYGPSDTLFAAFGDIYEVRKALFSELDSVEDPLLEDVAPAGLQPVGTEFPMTMNRLVESSMQFLLRERKETMQTWLKRADTYFPMIEQIFEEEGVPEELKYLAMIESGLNPRARSWASAVGMWQFIAATGRAYDLNVNAWVDDRMDPELATRAAAKHLKDLYRMYDENWQIALAGYNCSPRCIRRAMRNSGKSDPSFWDIYPYLPRENPQLHSDLHRDLADRFQSGSLQSRAGCNGSGIFLPRRSGDGHAESVRHCFHGGNGRGDHQGAEPQSQTGHPSPNRWSLLPPRSCGILRFVCRLV